MINFIFVICLLITVDITAQLNVSEQAPLKPGNHWVIAYDFNSSDRGTLTVLDSIVVIDSNKYYVLEGKDYSNGVLRGVGYKYCRIDSNDNYYRYAPVLYIETFGKYYKKNVGILEQWMNETAIGQFYYKIIDTSTTNWNGYFTKVKLLEITDSSLFYQWQYWSDDFGLLQVIDFESGPADYLIACVIDGKVYGDTTVTDIEELDINNPQEFYLSQNYPNPFNPKTNIEFNIPKTDFVTLKVYDILGKKVAVLIEKEMSTGKYRIEFNGNNLSSGVYIYVLKTSKYSATNKMIIMK